MSTSGLSCCTSSPPSSPILGHSHLHTESLDFPDPIKLSPRPKLAIFESKEQLALLVATFVLSIFAFKRNPRVAAFGLALGGGLAAFGDKLGLRHHLVSASGGCSGALSALSQSTIPWWIGVPVFYKMQEHHLRHDPVYIASATFGLAVQVVHLAQRCFSSSARENGWELFSKK